MPSKLISIFLFLILSSALSAMSMLRLNSPQQAYNLTVLIQSNNQDCSGILLNANTVLTAAHCTTTGLNDQIKIFFHVAKSNGQLASSKARQVIIHPSYIDTAKVDFDLALIKLDEPAPAVLAAQLKPINLEFLVDKTSNDNSLGLLFGYGIRPWIDTKVTFKVKKYNLHNNYFHTSNDHYFTLNNFTAQACRGDSGGPLFAVAQNGIMNLVGIAIGINAVEPLLKLKIENVPTSQEFKNCSGIVYFHKLGPVYNWLTENLTAL